MKKTLLGFLFGIVFATSAVGFLWFQDNQKNSLYRKAPSHISNPEPVIITLSGSTVSEQVAWEDTIEYLHKNASSFLEDPKNIDDFASKTSFRESFLLYSVKAKQKSIWEKYWMWIYDSSENMPHSREKYKQKIWKAFDDIIEDNLSQNEYIPFLLDGAIFFSNQTLNSKIEACEREFSQMSWDIKSEGISYCKSMSYIYEAIRKNDRKYCEMITEDPGNVNLQKNCFDLLSIVK